MPLKPWGFFYFLFFVLRKPVAEHRTRTVLFGVENRRGRGPPSLKIYAREKRSHVPQTRAPLSVLSVRRRVCLRLRFTHSPHPPRSVGGVIYNRFLRTSACGAVAYVTPSRYTWVHSLQTRSFLTFGAERSAGFRSDGVSAKIREKRTFYLATWIRNTFFNRFSCIARLSWLRQSWFSRRFSPPPSWRSCRVLSNTHCHARNQIVVDVLLHLINTPRSVIVPSSNSLSNRLHIKRRSHGLFRPTTFSCGTRINDQNMHVHLIRFKLFNSFLVPLEI